MREIEHDASGERRGVKAGGVVNRARKRPPAGEGAKGRPVYREAVYGCAAVPNLPRPVTMTSATSAVAVIISAQIGPNRPYLGMTAPAPIDRLERRERVLQADRPGGLSRRRARAAETRDTGIR